MQPTSCYLGQTPSRPSSCCSKRRAKSRSDWRRSHAASTRLEQTAPPRSARARAVLARMPRAFCPALPTALP